MQRAGALLHSVFASARLCVLGFVLTIATPAMAADPANPTAEATKGSDPATPSDAISILKQVDGKPRIDWGTAGITFAADSIAIRRPRIAIDLPAGTDISETTANPNLLYALLRPAFDALEGVAIDQVKIEDGTVTIRSKGNVLHELTGLTADFAIERRVRSIAAKGSFDLRGAPIKFIASITRPAAEDPTDDISLKLKVSGVGLVATFDGNMKQDGAPKLDGELDVNVQNLRKLAAWAGSPIAEGAGLQLLETRGKMIWTNGFVSIADGVFNLDGNAARGVLSLDLRKERAALEGTLAIGQLDLSPYFPKTKSDPDALLDGIVPEIATTTTVKAPVLRDFDADIRLSVKAIRAHSFQTEEGAMTLSLRSGTLIADVAELRVFDGSAVGQLEFNAKDADVVISARGLLDKIAIEKALGWVTETRPIRGPTRLSIDLTGRGRTVGALVQSLKGDARLKMLDGGAFRVDVEGLMSKADGKVLVGWDAAGDRETEFTSLDARLLLDNGRISTKHLSARQTSKSVIGHGTINLKAQEVAVRLSLVDNVPDTAALPTDMSGPILMMKGPWDEPTISVEAKAEAPTVPPSEAGATQFVSAEN